MMAGPIEQGHAQLRDIVSAVAGSMQGVDPAAARDTALSAVHVMAAQACADEGRCPECYEPVAVPHLSDFGNGPEVRVISGCAPGCSRPTTRGVPSCR